MVFNLPGKRAESMESLLSLSDVELGGMEEHAGDMEDIDYHKRKIKRRVSSRKKYMYYRTANITS
jgi:hypothetical protein